MKTTNVSPHGKRNAQFFHFTWPLSPVHVTRFKCAIIWLETTTKNQFLRTSRNPVQRGLGIYFSFDPISRFCIYHYRLVFGNWRRFFVESQSCWNRWTEYNGWVMWSLVEKTCSSKLKLNWFHWMDSTESSPHTCFGFGQKPKMIDTFQFCFSIRMFSIPVPFAAHTHDSILWP